MSSVRQDSRHQCLEPSCTQLHAAARLRFSMLPLLPNRLCAPYLGWFLIGPPDTPLPLSWPFPLWPCSSALPISLFSQASSHPGQIISCVDACLRDHIQISSFNFYLERQTLNSSCLLATFPKIPQTFWPKINVQEEFIVFLSFNPLLMPQPSGADSSFCGCQLRGLSLYPQLQRLPVGITLTTVIWFISFHSGSSVQGLRNPESPFPAWLSVLYIYVYQWYFFSIRMFNHTEKDSFKSF